ncbi:hypothetical protein GRI89_13065 [Altererythrobacter salegens]|uniref:DAGKc domain-containing protein n=1 Tax=Croceibacterium salegens TaxID=1737568 RepID=A0A6I4SYL8_9SPHN|nr:diacylglycerol kinase family protein [Croceibacterium salegens]MXO60469.1 hypothetical protein [Croceibacterium salegens]
MGAAPDIWLICNPASGSNDAAGLAALEDRCGDLGFRIAGKTVFPEEDLPDGAALDAAGVGLVAIFTGDGTINAVIGRLDGWGGQVLILPGGTMNLLYHRLHGDRPFEEVLRLVAAGEADVRRPGVIGCNRGVALAGLLAGPGTSWFDVRETMRDGDVLGVVESAAQAIGETLAEPGIACREAGSTEGYPLIMLTPHDEGIEVAAYHAETTAEFLSQGWALLRRSFREGPHDVLGTFDRLILASTDGAPFGIMIDGEKREAEAVEEFRLVACGVDLLATATDD